MSLKNILIIIVLIGLFIVFRPQIMQWVYTIKSEFSPTSNKANATYQEFKQLDLYRGERKLENTMDKLAK